MKFSVNFIERRAAQSPSIERVFRKVAEGLNKRGIETFFEQLPFGDGTLNVIRNLRNFRPKKADIYHVTGHATYIGLILPRDHTVITFHDTTLLSLRRGFRREVLEKLYYVWPARRARQVTAISTSTADILAKLSKIDRMDVRVVDNPCLVDAAEHTKAFDSACPRILQIGTAPNKNLSNLLRAVSGLKCTLHIVGAMTRDLESALAGSGVCFEHSASLNDNEMIDAYSRADIVTLCSTMEGFGLPIIEAQAMHVPVVTSNFPPMNEVAGDAAIKVDPHDPNAIRTAIQSIIDDENLRTRLVTAGRTNAARFAPERIAAEYEEVYAEILNSLNR